MPTGHQAAARTVFDVWGSGELHRLDAVVAADVIHHDPYDPHGAAGGLAGMKKTITERRAAYPDMAFTVHRQVVDNDQVATHWTAAMTHDGRPVTLAGITIDRFAEGKIVEAWRVMDMLGFSKQLKP